jgi:hypothetical protein
VIAISLCAGLSVAIAWCGHNADSAAYAEDFDLALRDCGLTRKTASVQMGLDAGGNELSKMLAGTKPLNVYRVVKLGPVFTLAMLKRQGARVGATILTQQEREFVLSVARLGRRRVAKVLPGLYPERRSA